MSFGVAVKTGLLTAYGDLDDLAAELLGHGVNLGWTAVTVAGEPHKTARMALGQVMLNNHLADGLALDLWG